MPSPSWLSFEVNSQPGAKLYSLYPTQEDHFLKVEGQKLFHSSLPQNATIATEQIDEHND